LRRSSHRLSQFFEKQSRALEISSLESLRKPGIDRFQQIACISTATLGVLQPSKALVVRSSQDRAFCRRAKSSDRRKRSSAAVACDLSDSTSTSPLIRSASGRGSTCCERSGVAFEGRATRVLTCRASDRPLPNALDSIKLLNCLINSAVANQLDCLRPIGVPPCKFRGSRRRACSC
jgi:hypothetical protein